MPVNFELPFYPLKIRQGNQFVEVFDPVRKKYIEAGPEEMVRQMWIAYLKDKKQVPLNRMMVEQSLIYNGRTKRFDLVVAGDYGEPLIVFEFKAPNVPVNQSTFNQAAVYNELLKAKYILVSNGEKHYLAEIDHDKNCSLFLENLPIYYDLIS